MANVRATIRDVARLAGASTAAVSAVLNGSGQHNIRVGQATRARIVAAAAELGYTPNRLAQSLVTGRTGVLGLVFPYSGAYTERNPFFMQIVPGIFDEVVEQKYNIMLHTAIGENWNETDPNALIDPRVAGLLLVLPEPNSAVIARCRERRFPCVALVYEPDSEEVCAVNADDFQGGLLATEHLLRLGHRRIAHLVGRPGVFSTEARKRGYLAALEEAGVEADPTLLIPAGYDWSDGYRATLQLLALPPSQRPTAAFAANDLCAEGVLKALREHGLRAPDDLALVGYDDTWFAAITQPALTSVHMPIYSIGKVGAQLLITLVEGREPAIRQPFLPVSLTIRDSCGASQTRAEESRAGS